MYSAVMFVSHKLSPTKKTFQKPNILRRKPKVAAVRPSLAHSTAPSLASYVKTKTVTDATKAEWSIETPVRQEHLEVITQDVDYPVLCLPQHAAASAASGPGAQDVHAATHVDVPLETDLQDEKILLIMEKTETSLVDDVEPEVVDVEAFLNGGGGSAQHKAQYESQTELDDNSVSKWEMDFGNASDTLTMQSYEGAAGAGAGAGAAGAGARRGHLQCSEPDCRKVFVSEQRLRRHGAVHGKRGARAAAAAECPAWAPAGPGEEAGAGEARAACRRVFAARDLLARHLREEHAPDDAPHRCGECERRFFWAAGLRAHSRAHSAAARARLACAWPGCGRAFRQPCRLREHARAHTGDRPYRCSHPGCGWAFRTASKLMRHARRHTGERRHACACGRAFRRREHLREHQARHRAAAAPGVSECSEPAPAAGRAGGAGGAGTAAEERAARTHCAWPLARAPPDCPEERSAVRSDLFLAAAADDSQRRAPRRCPRSACSTSCRRSSCTRTPSTTPSSTCCCSARSSPSAAASGPASGAASGAASGPASVPAAAAARPLQLATKLAKFIRSWTRSSFGCNIKIINVNNTSPVNSADKCGRVNNTYIIAFIIGFLVFFSIVQYT